VAGAPVLANVAQFNGLAEKCSLTLPEVILTAGLDAWHPDSRPRRRAERGTPSDVDALGENEIVPASRQVT